MSIIEVKHVTKEYRLGQLQSIRQSALNGLNCLLGRPIKTPPLFKALDDVNFTVNPGEVLGIIGHNGAGKSTLLKILAGITKSTIGSVKVKGKVAPLIEVGAGLVGDLTGRENIYLNGTILGLSRVEIKAKLDEIISFAELEEFIDTPIKRYSSGMSVRLGFAIATSVTADILIVDEVLAVGDLAFQRKCFERMEGLIKQEGRTVLLVSHNIRQVERMCRRVILLDQGKALAEGDPRTVCDLFYSRSNQLISQQAQANAMHRIVSSGEVRVNSIDLLDCAGKPTSKIRCGDALAIRICFSLGKRLIRPEFHVGTHTTDFIYITGNSTAVLFNRPDYVEGTHEILHVIPSFPVVPGTYCIRFAVIDGNSRIIFHGETLKVFTVQSKDADTALQDELRLVHVPVEWILQGQHYTLK